MTDCLPVSAEWCLTPRARFTAKIEHPVLFGWSPSSAKNDMRPQNRLKLSMKLRERVQQSRYSQVLRLAIRLNRSSPLLMVGIGPDMKKVNLLLDRKSRRRKKFFFVTSDVRRDESFVPM